jgi:caa(3)-type oxidase subunit IV
MTTAHHQHADEHVESKATYLYVWGALIFLTIVEILLAYNQVFPPKQMLSVLLALSVVKSILIIGWFMHLKGETRLMKWLLMGSLCMCLTLMLMFFPDATRILRLGTGR